MTEHPIDQRKSRIRLELLKLLDGLHGLMQRRNILYADLNLHISPRATLAEFDKEIGWLESAGLIAIRLDPLGGSPYIKLTPAGGAEVDAQNA